MVSRLKRSAAGTSNLEYFARYATIGAVVVAVDVSTFQTLVLLHVYLPLTTTIAFVLATLVHFFFNKLWTFRVKGTPHRMQILTYLTVLSASFVITQLVVETAVLVFHVIPIAAKILALFAQLPVSFFGHRYFTFREGREFAA